MMLGFKPRGLRFEITVSLALLVAAAVGLVGLVVFKYAQREMIQLKIENGLIISSALEHRLRQGPTEDEFQLLVSALSLAGFEGIVVMDRQGHTLARSDRWDWKGRPDRTDLDQVLAAGEPRTYLGGGGYIFFGPDPTLAMAVPLRQGPRVIAVAGLYSSLDDLRIAWARARWIIFLYLALDTLIIVIFGTYLLSNRLVRPLAGMLDRVRQLAEGEYKPGRAAISRGSEIGELEEAFENMAARLQENRIELEQNIATLEKAQEDLIRSEKMASVGRLAAGVAHELGNPLSSIQGFIHLIDREDISKEEKADFLHRVRSELDRMDSIIRLLLDYARPARSNIEPVDLNKLVETGLGLIEVQKGFKDFQIRKELAPDLPPARAEENKLIQVLLNLLNNAVQAMAGRIRPEERVLTLETGLEGADQVFISVADTGIGIAGEDLESIFDPFFTRKEPGQGAGLGLAVSRSIIESFGGRIKAASILARGSRFTVLLPVLKKGDI